MLSVGRFHFGHMGFSLNGINGRQQSSRQISCNLFADLLAWMIESRKFYNENVGILLHPQQIDLFTRTPHFVH